MTKEEMREYLASTGLYERSDWDLDHVEHMLDTDKTVSIKDLAEHFIETDEEFNGELWNIRQILSNIRIIVPVEDRK
jgi:hypothetical protein